MGTQVTITLRFPAHQLHPETDKTRARSRSPQRKNHEHNLRNWTTATLSIFNQTSIANTFAIGKLLTALTATRVINDLMCNKTLV